MSDRPIIERKYNLRDRRDSIKIVYDPYCDKQLPNDQQRSFSEIRSTSENIMRALPERNHFQRMDIKELPVQLDNVKSCDNSNALFSASISILQRQISCRIDG